MSANLAAEERLTVWGFRRRYLRETRSRPGTQPSYAALASEAVSRLSIAGVHHLLELLRDDREGLRWRGEDEPADLLTSAIRDLDSRIQILADLLH